MATPSEDMVRQAWIKWALSAYEEAQKLYEKYDDYYFGDQKLVYSTARWTAAFGDTFKDFADNFCQVVVDSLADRLEIIGWKSEDTAAQKVAEDLWFNTPFPVEAMDAHVQALVKGDSYIICWPDPDADDEIQAYYNDALDVNVFYDPKNLRRPLRASKKWQDETGRWHLYLYHRNRIERYIVEGPHTDEQAAMFATFQMPDPSGALPQGWVKEDEDLKNEYDLIPVFHFKNRSAGSTHGTSELKTVIPMQDAINKNLLDAMLASEFSGFPQKWMAGGGHPKDGWKAGADRVWATTDPSAKFGQFDAADLEKFVAFIEMEVGHLAKISQTPMHYLRPSGDMPSGEALKTAESGLVKKALNRSKRWGWVWRDIMAFAVELKSKKKPTAPLIPVWQSPETRYHLEEAQTAQLKSILGIPLEQLWSEHFGYTEAEIEKFKGLNRAVAASVLADVVAQVGQLPPGAEGVAATPQQLMQLLQDAKNSPVGGSGGALDLTQILALLPKSVTGQTTAGEATTKPQPNTRPPASPTRRSRGFKA